MQGRDTDNARSRRRDDSVELRKSKREDQLMKKRHVNPSAQADDDDDSDAENANTNVQGAYMHGISINDIISIPFSIDLNVESSFINYLQSM